MVFPLIQVRKRQQFRRDNPASVEESEKSRAVLATGSSGTLFPMRHLERCLANQDELKELQDFASHREFAGENIKFLSQVLEFKVFWSRMVTMGHYSPILQRAMFRPAVAIFHNLVCTDTASISINIEGRIYNALNAGPRRCSSCSRCR